MRGKHGPPAVPLLHLSPMLSTRLKLWNLERQRKKLEKERRRISTEARKQKTPKLEEEWWSEHSFDFDFIDWEISSIITRDLLRQAQKLQLPIPTPKDEDKWEPAEDTPPGYRFLSPIGIAEVRAAIRKEKRERREAVAWWVKMIATLVGAFTGIIGALIGLIAILKSG